MPMFPKAWKNILTGRPWLRAILRICGSALALLILFHFLPLAEVWRTLRRLPLHLWLLVIAGYLAAHLIAVNKWRMMVNLAGARLTFRQAVRCYFSGLFSTLFLPSIVGGDVVRGALALRSGQSRAAIFMGGLLDRILDFAALAMLIVLGAALVPGTLPAQARRIFIIAGIALVVLLALITPVILWFPARKISFTLRRRIVRLRRAARSMRCKPHYVAAALCLGLVVQGSFIWLTSRVADSTGLHLLFRAWLFAWPFAKLSAVIPITQGGIGVREATLVVLLVPFGAPAVKTAAVGLAWEAVIISGGLMAGLVAFLLGRLPVSDDAVASLEVAAENSPSSKLQSL
ncbi:MAG: lysylphosphatidylglycerol synthase transmembrane domain-containing protein [Candidatus Acidiferrales bacterium]